VVYSITLEDLLDDIEKALSDKKVNSMQKLELCHFVDTMLDEKALKDRQKDLIKFGVEFGKR